jgi:hypothetical protein
MVRCFVVFIGFGVAMNPEAEYRRDIGTVCFIHSCIHLRLQHHAGFHFTIPANGLRVVGRGPPSPVFPDADAAEVERLFRQRIGMEREIKPAA